VKQTCRRTAYVEMSVGGFNGPKAAVLGP
jgi:hypothetical protein